MATLTVIPNYANFEGDGRLWESDWDYTGDKYEAVHDAASCSFITDYNELSAVGQSRDLVDSQIFFKVSRQGFFFDTSDLPDDAAISAATIDMIYFTGTSRDTEFNVTLVSGDDLEYPELDYTDYGDLLDDTTALANVIDSSTLTEDYQTFTFTLNASGLAKISKTGITPFALRSSRDINSNEPTGYENVRFYTSRALTAEYRPVLTITYVYTPTVTTQTNEGVRGTQALGRGTITDLGNGSVTGHGHCWATTVDPTIALNDYVNNGAKSTTGAFFTDIIDLVVGTGYYTRAFATNAAGTAYGDNVYFLGGGTHTRAGLLWEEVSNTRYFDANSIERTQLNTDDVDDTPVNAATTAPVSSNWAYDHADDEAAHNAIIWNLILENDHDCFR